MQGVGGEKLDAESGGWGVGCRVWEVGGYVEQNV